MLRCSRFSLSDTAVTWYIPIGFQRFTADGNETAGTFSNFRFGNDAIIGWGWAPNRGKDAGILLGGGLHTDFAYFYRYPALNDLHTTFFDPITCPFTTQIRNQ